MLTTLILIATLAAEPAPAVGAVQTTQACMSASVEHPALALPAYDWEFIPPRYTTACDETPIGKLFISGVNPLDPVEHEPEINLDTPDGGATDSPQATTPTDHKERT